MPQEPRQHTAATQPYVIGDAVVPQEMDYAPEGFELVNQGRIFTPFWDKVSLYKPQMGVNWPPSSYDPETHRMFICGIDHVASSVSDQKPFAPPEPAQRPYMGGGWREPGCSAPRHVHRDGPDHQSHRLAAAVAEQLLQRHAGDEGRAGLRRVAAMAGSRRWTPRTASVSGSSRRMPVLPRRPAPSLHDGKQYVVVLSAGTMFGGGTQGRQRLAVLAGWADWPAACERECECLRARRHRWCAAIRGARSRQGSRPLHASIAWPATVIAAPADMAAA